MCYILQSSVVTRLACQELLLSLLYMLSYIALSTIKLGIQD